MKATYANKTYDLTDVEDQVELFKQMHPVVVTGVMGLFTDRLRQSVKGTKTRNRQLNRLREGFEEFGCDMFLPESDLSREITEEFDDMVIYTWGMMVQHLIVLRERVLLEEV